MQLNSPKRITINASSAVIQVVVIGVVYFFLYRFLIDKLGANLLGLWSLIVATSSIASLANLGFSSGLVKFVAEKNAQQESGDLGKLIFTALVSITLLYLVLSLIILVVAPYLLGYFMNKEYLSIALTILPWSLSCLLINAIGGVFTSALEGIQKNYLRNFIYSVTSVLFLLFSLLLVPRLGILGVALAQNIQAILVVGYTFYQARKNIPAFRVRKWDWDPSAFRSMLNYGYKFQLISVLQLIVDPITKALLSKFGGLSTLAYYEMAYRLTSQVRSVIINAYQVTIPVIAHYNQTQKSYLRTFYLRTFPFVFTSGMIATAALVFFSGVLSRLWIGHYELIFVNYSVIVALGMVGNILCAPAYFNYLGIGHLNLLVAVQSADALVNVVLCFLLSLFSPTYGVVYAWSLSTILGAGLILIFFHRKKRLSLTELMRKNDWKLLIVSGLVVITSTLLYNNDKFIVFYNLQNVWIELLSMSALFIGLFYLNIKKNHHFLLYKNKISHYLNRNS